MGGFIFIVICLLVIFLFIYNKVFDTKTFIKDISPILNYLKESDYEFLLKIKYGDQNYDIKQLMQMRIRNAIVMFMFVVFILIIAGASGYNITPTIIGIGLIIGLLLAIFSYKQQYLNLKAFYKARLHTIDLLLPYYLKGLEILLQHYTVPVALSKSIDNAPDVFKEGLRELVQKIDDGDFTIQPYLDFANKYPVRDCMRMMRLLYRLGLGKQEDKHEQIMQFSKTVSSLQNKARDIKYKERLEHIEGQTMIMLFSTGGGILALMFVSMTILMSSY